MQNNKQLLLQERIKNEEILFALSRCINLV
jgi:hypothetical protein